MAFGAAFGGGLAGACAANPAVRSRPGPAPAREVAAAAPTASLSRDARPAASRPPAPAGGPVAGPAASRPPADPAAPPTVAGAPSAGRPTAEPRLARIDASAPGARPTPARPAATVPGAVVPRTPPATGSPPVATAAPAPVPARAAAPRPFAEVVAALRDDPAFADHRALLDAAARAAPDATDEVRIARQPDLEAAARARVGRGTGFAVVTTYVEADGDARALRTAYLDFERVGEFTGKPSTTVLSRHGDVARVRVDGIRAAFGIRYGAKWTFEARTVEGDGALAILSRQVDDPATDAMLATRNLLLFVPGPDGVRVVEASDSVVDYEVPAFLRSLAVGAVFKEMKARVAGIRGHWREYVGRPDGTSLAGQRAAAR